MTYTATYSPDDNKLRIYGPRFDAETYAKVKAAGFRWAPKQELWVAPCWTPAREDLAIEIAGEIGDEDKSLVERATERSERFEDWKQSSYWADRAAGCLQNAKYKELPAVRARRIKGIEADLRKAEKTLKNSKTFLAAWSRVMTMTGKRADGTPSDARDAALYLANREGYNSFKFPLADYPRDPPASQYEGDMGIWSALEGNIITAEQARDLVVPGYERSIASCLRWIEHYENQLAYERAMLDEAGGTLADQTRPEVGGAIKSWHFYQGWSYIQKVNKVTVTILNPVNYGERCYRANVPFDKFNGIMSAAEVAIAKQEGRVRETGKGGKVTGFVLTPLGSPAEPTGSPKPEPVDDAAFRAMQASLKAGVKVQTVNQLFQTPKDLAQRAVDLADIRPGNRVLEPSAGTGALLGAMGGRMLTTSRRLP
jgi:hypothetical protein